MCESQSRGARGEADHLTGAHERACRLGDRLLLVAATVQPRLEAGIVRVRLRQRGRAAVHLRQPALLGQHVEIAADGHVRDVEQVRQLVHADGAARANFVQKEFLTMAGQHRVVARDPAHPPLESLNTKQAPRSHVKRDVRPP
jgi:hypothetical protein